MSHRCAASGSRSTRRWLASVDPWALALSVAAIIAIFRFKSGMLTTLAACCIAGISLYLLGPSGDTRVNIPARISAAMLATCIIASAFAMGGKTPIDLGENVIGAVPTVSIRDHWPRQIGRWTVVRDVTAAGGVAVEHVNDDPTEDRFRFAIYRQLSLKNFAAAFA